MNSYEVDNTFIVRRKPIKVPVLNSSSSVESPYEKLAKDIALMAVRDLKKEIAKTDKVTCKILELKRFFESDWFEYLTGLNGSYVYKKVIENEKQNSRNSR